MNLHSLPLPLEVFSLNLSALSFIDSIYPKLETGFAFTKDLNAGLFERYNGKIFGKNDTENFATNSGILGKLLPRKHKNTACTC